MKSLSTPYRAVLATLILAALPSALQAQFQRVVLLEEVTSVTCTFCPAAGRNVNDMIATYGDRAVSIRYHVNYIPIPKDPFFEANPTENTGRRNYYDAVAMPAIRVDGALNPPATEKAQVEARVQEELALESPLRIIVTQTALEGNVRRVSVAVTAGPEGLQAGYKLRIAAVERFVHDATFANNPYNGEVDLYDIMRDFVPSIDGQDIVLNPDETKTFTADYTIGAGWQADQMYAVAFVQDDFGDHQVLQAGFSSRPVAGIHSGNSIAGHATLFASPNPASANTSISYDLARPGTVSVVVRDIAGRVVGSVDAGMREQGSGRIDLDVSSLAPGVYSYLLTSDEYRGAGQIVVVR